MSELEENPSPHRLRHKWERKRSTEDFSDMYDVNETLEKAEAQMKLPLWKMRNGLMYYAGSGARPDDNIGFNE